MDDKNEKRDTEDLAKLRLGKSFLVKYPLVLNSEKN